MAACAALSLATVTPTPAQAPALGVTLPGTVPALVGSSALLGPVLGTQPVSLALTLPLRNTRDLNTLLHNLYDTKSSLQGQFLTPQQFTDRFGPTQADYDTLTQWAQAHGLTVMGTHAGRTLLDVAGSAANVQQAFGVHLLRYLDPSGREFYAPDANPTVDAAVAGTLSGIIGLDNAGIAGCADGFPSPVNNPTGTSGAVVGASGSPVTLTPSQVKAAYGLGTSTQTGTGQSVALFEADGYLPSDIAAYETNFGLPHLSPTNVLMSGATGKPQNVPSYDFEVTADIEMVLSLAPNVSNVYVYETPQTSQGFVAAYTKIADDDYASQVSTSWYMSSDGSAEAGVPSSMVNAENAAFEKMAALGQTMFSASGDYGAYADGSNLTVQDPASQPYVCAVGGTQLTVDSQTYFWSSEATWNSGLPKPNTADGSSGGGISNNWPIPFYQSQAGVVSSTSQGSSNNRNVPDVSLAASGNSDYYSYWNGGLYGTYGTSFAAPLWAAFTALVNQQRAANGFNPVGFINQYIYQIGTGLYGNYASDFHDIADGSTNLFYPAAAGYDLATGWGSLNGASLLADLAARGGAIPDTAPLYRLSEPAIYGHLYSIDPGEWRSSVANGSHYDGVQCHVFYNAQDAPGLTPLYRTSNAAGDHLYTIYYAEYRNSLANGAHDEGVEGYVYPTTGPPSGAVPLYRTYTASSGQHFYTDSYAEYQNSVSNGGTADGVVAYVLP